MRHLTGILCLLTAAPLQIQGFATPPSHTTARGANHFCKRSYVGTTRTQSSITDNQIVDTSSHEDQINQLLKGRHKWLGGAYHPEDCCVYGIPSHSGHVICLSPNNTEEDYTINFLPLPSAIATPKKDKSHQFKWLRGIIANDVLFGIPAWFDGVLTVDLSAWRKWRDVNPESRIADEELSDEFINILPLPNSDADDKIQNKRWMWHGAALNAEKSAIYCIPSNADRVLKVDLMTMRTSYLPIPASSQLTLSNKWYGGILGNDNAIYGVPYAAGSVLRIDANRDTVSLLGEYGTNQYNWHGGILANGNIYAFPAHSDEVLKIDTAKDLGEQDRISTLPIQRADYDVDKAERYKWLGGSMGSDGNVYGMPSDASSVLRIDTSTNVVTTFGHVQTTSSTNEDGERLLTEKNKWQGGVLANDGFIYAVPSNARGVLRIDSRSESQTNTPVHEPSRIEVIGELPDTKDKWQGGFLVGNGAIFAIPENCDRVLKVKPSIPGEELSVRFL